MNKLASPLITFAIAVGGVALAALSFRIGFWLPAIPVVAAAITMAAVRRSAKKQLPTDPVRAVQLMDWQAFAIAIIAVSGAALVIVLSTQFVIPEPAKAADDASPEAKAVADAAKAAYEQAKVLVGGASAALAALITALVTKPEDLDGAVGSATKSIFAGKYGQTPSGVMAPQDQGTTVNFPEASKAAAAAFKTGDWTFADRHERATVIESYMRQHNIGGSPQPNP